MTMQDLSPYFMNLFQTHPYMGILFAGFIAFIESLAIIGSIVPGSVMMGVVGFLLGAGIIPIKSTLISIFIGAFIGDYVSYIVGKKYKHTIVSHSVVQPYHHWILHAEAFMRKHGVLSIIIGRFVGPMRSIIPMIAGITHMHQTLFILAIIPTIILWSIVYLAPGFLLAALTIDMGESYFIGTFLKALVVAFGFALWHSLRTLALIVIPKLHKRQILLSETPTSLTHLIKLIILSCLAFVLIYQHLTKVPYTIFWDHAIHHYFLYQLSDQSIAFANLISKISSHVAYILINISICVVLYYHKHTRLLMIWAAFSICVFGFATLLKFGIAAPRPNPNLAATGFPSGHIFLTGSLWLCLTSIIEEKKPSVAFSLRRLSYLFIIAIFFSRLLLQAHWVTDLIASIFMALGTWHLFGYMVRTLEPLPNKHIQQIGASISLVMMTLLLIQSHIPLEQQPKFAAEITVNNMKDIGNLPKVRYSSFGKISQPLNYIWIGDEQSLANQFKRYGWTQYPADRSMPQRIVTLLTMNKYHSVLPIFPPKLGVKVPALVFGSTKGKTSTIARFWKIGGTLPTYIGTVSTETYPESYYLQSYFVCNPQKYDITNIIPNRGSGKITSNKPIKITNTLSPFCWNGKVLTVDSRK